MGGEAEIPDFGPPSPPFHAQIPQIQGCLAKGLNGRVVFVTFSPLDLLLSACGHFVAAAVLTALSNHLALIPWRRARGAHWTERARLLWPVRASVSSNIVFLPGVLYLLADVVLPEKHGYWLSDGLAALGGGFLACYFYEREVFGHKNFANWFSETLPGLGLRALFWAGLIVSIFLMPRQLGWAAALISLGYLALYLGLQWGGFVYYLRWVKFLVPAPEHLIQLVHEAQRRTPATIKAVWLMKGIHPLAYALPVTAELLISERLLELCNDNEVGAILDHELAHLTESKLTLAGRLLTGLVLFPCIFLKPGFAAFGPAGVLMPVVGIMLLVYAGRALSVRLEKKADQAAHHREFEGGLYARALEKLYQANQLPATNPAGATHPNLYDRMLAAGLTPDYERPRVPLKQTRVALAYAVAFGVLAMFKLRSGQGW